jgi:drug/metabolite transporter (DMT)-like permease
MKHPVLLADLGLLATAVAWGAAFAVLKDTLNTFQPMTLLAVRFAFAAVILSLVFIRRVSRMRWPDVKAGFIVGFFLFLGFIAQTYGLVYTTAGKNAFLTTTYVVVVPFMGWALTRRFPGFHAFLSAGLCIAGVGFLTLGGEGVGGFNKGDALTLLCAVFYSAQLMSIDHYAKRMDPIVLAVTQMIAMVVFCGMFAIPLETWPSAISPRGMIGMAYLVLFATVLAFAVQMTAQRHSPPTHVSLILSTESFFGALTGVLFLGEQFTAKMTVGAVLVFGAILVTEVLPRWVRQKMENGGAGISKRWNNDL